MISKFTTVDEIIAKIIRDLGLSMTNEDVPYQDYVSWIGEGLLHIGSYYQFKEKIEIIDIEDYTGKLPCDFYKTISLNGGYYCADFDKNLIHNDCDTSEDFKKYDISPSYNSYNINMDTITIGYRRGKIYLRYLAIPVDDKGFPLVPDDISFFDAMFWKVAYHLSLRGYEFKNTQLRDVNFTKRKWDFYCIQARANANMPDAAGMERIAQRFLSWGVSGYKGVKGYTI